MLFYVWVVLSTLLILGIVYLAGWIGYQFGIDEGKAIGRNLAEWQEQHPEAYEGVRKHG
jgi:hypothetical protein